MKFLLVFPEGTGSAYPAQTFQLIEPFNPFCSVQEILRLGISETIYLYYQDIWYFKQTCLIPHFFSILQK